MGIPDEIPAKLAASNRAPSWKAIAVAILKNDHNLLSLGFAQSEPDAVLMLINYRKEMQALQKQESQHDLFARARA